MTTEQREELNYTHTGFCAKIGSNLFVASLITGLARLAMWLTHTPAPAWLTVMGWLALGGYLVMVALLFRLRRKGNGR
jgi:hypothetical protein